MKNYKKIRPYHVKNSQAVDKIDIAILRLLGYKRDVISKILDSVESPCKKAFYSPYKEMTEDERRQERHAQRDLMRAYNINRFPGIIDLHTLETNMIGPFKKWTLKHFEHNTQHTVDVLAINRMTYKCLKKAIQKDLYRPFFKGGYIWVVPTILCVEWKNNRGISNFELMQEGYNPVDSDGEPFEAHHAAGDYATHKNLFYKQYAPEKAHLKTLKERFLTECIILYLTQKTHRTKGTHIWNCSPNRTLFAAKRKDANKTLLYPFFKTRSHSDF